MDLSLSCQHWTECICSNATRRHVIVISSASVRLLSQGQIFHSCISATACYSQGEAELVTRAVNTLNPCFPAFSPSNTRSNPRTLCPRIRHPDWHERNTAERFACRTEEKNFITLQSTLVCPLTLCFNMALLPIRQTETFKYFVCCNLIHKTWILH